jgi:ATP-binding cassette, subfamily B, bacterial
MDIRDYGAEELRTHFAVVSQASSAFNRSFRENVAYGLPVVTEDQIVEAVRLASVDDVIFQRENGLDEIVGENGNRFSGGEIQRLNLARALIRPGRPILVLDEATSALDTPAEDRIRKAVEKAVGGRTVVAIAHRISTVQKMNRIVFLSNGTIVESGSHGELLELDGRYAEVWRRQAHLSMRIGG